VSRIYWDTILFAYWFEDRPENADRVEQVHSWMQGRGETLCTSVFTIGEVLTGPSKRQAEDLIAQIRQTLRPPVVELLPFSDETAECYARIRAENRVSPADAIHLASAAQAGVSLFLTNDRRLSKLVIPGIQFIAGLDLNLF
jgi:predicted nucleic acid-binding protein